MIESKLSELKNLTKTLSMRDRELHLFKNFMDLLPIGVYVIDSNSKTYYFNRKAIEILGKGIDPSHPMEDLSSVYSVYKKGTNEEYLFEEYPIFLALQGVPARKDDMEVERPDGRVRICARATPIFDINGSVEYAISTFYIVKD